MSATDAASGWVSPRGSFLSQGTIDRADMRLLARAYTAERSDSALPEMDSATRLCWQLGYNKPAPQD